jgi:hypothetical protein
MEIKKMKTKILNKKNLINKIFGIVLLGSFLFTNINSALGFANPDVSVLAPEITTERYQAMKRIAEGMAGGEVDLAEPEVVAVVEETVAIAEEPAVEQKQIIIINPESVGLIGMLDLLVTEKAKQKKFIEIQEQLVKDGILNKTGEGAEAVYGFVENIEISSEKGSLVGLFERIEALQKLDGSQQIPFSSAGDVTGQAGLLIIDLLSKVKPESAVALLADMIEIKFTDLYSIVSARTVDPEKLKEMYVFIRNLEHVYKTNNLLVPNEIQRVKIIVDFVLKEKRGVYMQEAEVTSEIESLLAQGFEEDFLLIKILRKQAELFKDQVRIQEVLTQELKKPVISSEAVSGFSGESSGLAGVADNLNSLRVTTANLFNTILINPEVFAVDQMETADYSAYKQALEKWAEMFDRISEYTEQVKSGQEVNFGQFIIEINNMETDILVAEKQGLELKFSEVDDSIKSALGDKKASLEQAKQEYVEALTSLESGNKADYYGLKIKADRLLREAEVTPVFAHDPTVAFGEERISGFLSSIFVEKVESKWTMNVDGVSYNLEDIATIPDIVLIPVDNQTEIVNLAKAVLSSTKILDLEGHTQNGVYTINIWEDLASLGDTRQAGGKIMDVDINQLKPGYFEGFLPKLQDILVKELGLRTNSEEANIALLKTYMDKRIPEEARDASPIYRLTQALTVENLNRKISDVVDEDSETGQAIKSVWTSIPETPMRTVYETVLRIYIKDVCLNGKDEVGGIFTEQQYKDALEIGYKGIAERTDLPGFMLETYQEGDTTHNLMQDSMFVLGAVANQETLSSIDDGILSFEEVMRSA